MKSVFKSDFFNIADFTGECYTNSNLRCGTKSGDKSNGLNLKELHLNKGGK